jgi:hypothetical protein
MPELVFWFLGWFLGESCFVSWFDCVVVVNQFFLHRREPAQTGASAKRHHILSMEWGIVESCGEFQLNVWPFGFGLLAALPDRARNGNGGMVPENGVPQG